MSTTRINDPLYDLIEETENKPTSDSIRLRELEGQIIGLTLRYPGGHGTVFGRVRIVIASPAIWVGDFCVPYDAWVYPDGYDKGEYIFNLRNQD